MQISLTNSTNQRTKFSKLLNLYESGRGLDNCSRTYPNIIPWLKCQYSQNYVTWFWDLYTFQICLENRSAFALTSGRESLCLTRQHWKHVFPSVMPPHNSRWPVTCTIHLMCVEDSSSNIQTTRLAKCVFITLWIVVLCSFVGSFIYLNNKNTKSSNWK